MKICKFLTSSLRAVCCVLIILFGYSLSAQSVIVPFSGSDSTTQCTGTITEHGGTGNYSNGANGIFKIQSSGPVTLTFSSFSTESCCDRLYVYDGNNISSPLIGNYGGSALPNGGTITGTANGLTLRFISDGSITSSGFSATWGANSTTNPTASFNVPSNSVPYNTDVQFTNTTVNGGTYLWMFGDGTTSTLTNPTHRYTTTGTKNVRLVATNCLGSDTSSITVLTVQSAPNASLSVDTVFLSLACGTSGSTSFNVSNTGLGNLNYEIDLIQGANSPSYYESFNNGLGGFSDINNNHSISFPTSGAVSGASYLRVQNGFGGFNTVETNLQSTLQPKEISYHVRSEQFGSLHGEIGIGTGNVFSRELLFYSQFNFGNLRLNYRNGAGGFTTTRNITQAENQWYHIQLKNIDWVLRTYDIYVNSVLEVTAAGMFSSTVSGVNYIYGYNNNGAAYGLDEIEFDGSDLTNIFTYNPKTGNLGNNSNNSIFVNANATGLNAGTYYFDFAFSSNDTVLDSLHLPLVLEVTGDPVVMTDKNCTNFGSIFSAINYSDSIMISNQGCDTLNVASIVGSSSSLSFSSSNFDLAPYDTTFLSFSFNTNTLGAFNDTIVISGPDTTFSYCVTGFANAAPAITLNSTNFTVNHTGCGDSASFQLVLGNNGLDTLNWGVGGIFNQSVSDDFESSTFSSIWGATGAGVSLSSQSCGVIAGTNSLVFDGGFDRKITTTPLNLSAGGTIEFDMQRTIFCNWPESNDGINLEYSLDNGNTWANISYLYFNSSTFTRVSEQIPPAAQTTGVQVRLFQPFHSGTTDVWLVDNFNINSTFSNQLYFSPDTGLVEVNTFDTVTVYVPTAGLTTGVYNIPGFIFSNDPVNNPSQFNVSLNLTGVPNLTVPSTCLSLDTVVMNTSISDSVMIFNDGCGDLVISSVTTQNTSLTLANTPSIIMPGDTAFLHYTFSPTLGPLNFIDSIQILSNDGLDKICVNAFVESAPTINVSPNNLSLTHFGCTDSASFQLVVNNTGLNTLNWKASSTSTNSYLDDFESGSYNNTLWSSLVNTSVGSSCGIINGLNSLSFQGQGFRYIQSNPLNLTAGGIIEYNVLFRGTCETPDFGEGLDLEYSLNNGQSWVNFNYHYINNTAVQQVSASIPTAAQTTNTLIRLSQRSNSGSGFDNWVVDDFLINASVNSNTNVYFVPDTGNTAVSAFDTINGYIDINGYNSGVHTVNVYISSNDPLNPELVIPVTLTINGSPEVELLQSGCITFSGVQQGANARDSIFVTNTGCDTLMITGVNNNLSEFSSLGLPINLAPGDTSFIEVNFNPITVGTFSDTLIFANNDSAFSVCVSGTSIGAPLLNLPADTLEFTLNKCKVIGNKDFRINNSGLGALTYTMNFGGFYASSKQTYNTDGASTVHSFTGLPALSISDTIEIKVVLHGDYDDFNERTSMNIDGVYNTGYLIDQNLNYTNDTVTYTFYGFNPVNWTSDNNLNITLYNTFQVDGGAGSFHEVLIRITSQVNWVSVIGSTTGTVAANGSVNKNILFNAATLPVGVYGTNLRITNNGPSNQPTNVPVIFNVVSEPSIAATDTCLNFPITLLGDTSIQTISIFNDGCAPLNVASVTSTNSAFKLVGATGISTVQIGDSLHYTVRFIPTVVGSFNANILVISNGEILNICLTGASGALPVSAFNISPENSCKGEFSFIDRSQFNPSSYYWDFGDGNNSTLSNPSHSYTKPGSYKVSLRVNNTYGFDTISQMVTANPLFANFSTSTNFVVEQDSATSFYDSSITANSWAWDFGDGNTSTVQNPTHTYVTKGNYIVNLTVTDNRGCTQNVSKNMLVAYSIGIEENLIDPQMYIYPNPAADYFTLKTNVSISSIKIFDATGKVIYNEVLSGETNEEYSINTSNLSNGIYFIRVFDSNGVTLGVERLAIGK